MKQTTEFSVFDAPPTSYGGVSQEAIWQKKKAECINLYLPI